MRILVLSWRDTGHPDGGGSELYVEQLVDGLAGAGHDVTLFTARYPGSTAQQRRLSGVRVVRDGGRLGVYPAAALAYWRGRLGRPEVILEVQNGMPFLARLWARQPAKVVLSHHVHRAQWMMIFDPVLARLGWLVESRLAPWINRGLRYATISQASKNEHVDLGIRAEDMTVIYAGTDHLAASAQHKRDTPTLIVLGRLVPHKRIEWAIDAVASLAGQYPQLRLDVVGDGWWSDKLREYAHASGAQDRVIFHGFVDEETKKLLLAQAWLTLMPSVKEGWGLVVSEAGIEQTPAVAFASGGGVTESIEDGVTGVLVTEETSAAFAAAVGSLVADPAALRTMGRAASEHARRFSWVDTVAEFEAVLTAAAQNRSAPARALRQVRSQEPARRLANPRVTKHQ
ncbi:MAG: glycosyltransferase family 4 protein [Nostocoides sp.]